MAPKTRSRANTDNLVSLLDQFTQLKARWLKSTCRAQLLNILEQNKPANGWSITKAIAFGLGALTGPYRGTAMMQLVFFLDVAENVRAKNKPGIELYLQEPQVSEAPTEKDFLASIGVKVIDDPTGQEMCAPGVFAMAPCTPVEPEIIGQCEHRWPDLFFGLDVDSTIMREYELFILEARGQVFPIQSSGWRGHADKCIDRAIRSGLEGKLKETKEKRIMLHRQRVDLLRAYQINHIEVELPLLDVHSPYDHPKVRYQPLEFYKLHFRREAAPASCDFCADGGRFSYRDVCMDFLNNPKGLAWGSEEEREYEVWREEVERPEREAAEAETLSPTRM